MAIATTTAAVIAAGIGAAGGVTGGVLASKGNKEAAKSQERSNQAALTSQDKAAAEALAFEREREAARKAEHDMAMQAYRAQWNAREQARVGLLRRYGVNVPPGLMGGGAPQGALSLGQLARQPGGYTPPTPAGMVQGRPAEPPVQLEGWERWDKPRMV